MKSGLSILLSIVLAIIISLITPLQSKSQNDNQQAEKLLQTIHYIKLGYIEDVDEEDLVANAIIGMLKELDPHSSYLSKEDLQKANEPLLGSFEGIGVQFNIINDTIVVVSPIPDGPSEMVGIMPGDKIISIDGEEATGTRINNQFVLDKLRGEKGSKVAVEVYRKGDEGLLDFTITRDKIPINSMDAAFMAAPEIGYIKLNRFSRTTMDEYNEAMKMLKEQGMKHLILDLNFNSGGYLDVAISLTDEFLERDKLIVYTEGKAFPTQRANSTWRGSFKKGKLVVLINEGSASASEILSGAIQDWDRGLIVGRRSFGKGLVQRPFDLVDGSAIRLTTAQYFTPTGRSIQKPYDEGAEKYFRDLSDRLERGELVDPDKISFPDSLQFKTPGDRIVYGGGGIMPDFFIPLDTTRASEFYSSVLRRGVINSFSIEYVNDNRGQLSREYSTLEEFMNNFEVTDKLMDEFIDYAKNRDIEKPEDVDEESLYHLRRQVKGLIARSMWDFAAYIQINMQNDKAFQRALEIMQDDTFDELRISY